MTLVQLEYIVALDNYRSFVTAAEKCFVTQPTLSMQIQKLEDNLGVKIFDRTKQPVVPTEIGAEIIEQARILLAESQKIKEIISDRQKELSGELKVGIIPTISPYLLPRIINRFIEKYPQVKLVVWEQTTEEIIQNIKLGKIDCGILSTPLYETNLLEIPVFYETFVAYASKSSKIFKKKAISPDDIDLEEIWILNEGHCMRNQVIDLCSDQIQRLQAKRAYHYESSNVETLRKMVDKNKGLTILPELATFEFNEDQQDRVRYFEDPEPVREISMVTNDHFVKLSLLQTLIEEITEMVPEKMRVQKKNRKVLRIQSAKL